MWSEAGPLQHSTGFTTSTSWGAVRLQPTSWGAVRLQLFTNSTSLVVDRLRCEFASSKYWAAGQYLSSKSTVSQRFHPKDRSAIAGLSCILLRYNVDREDIPGMAWASRQKHEANNFYLGFAATMLRGHQNPHLTVPYATGLTVFRAGTKNRGCLGYL